MNNSGISRTLTLGDIVAEHAINRPQDIAFVDGPTRLTWPELDARVNRLANALQAAGFGRGDRVLWLGQNSWRCIEAMIAAGKLGGMLCPVNWRQTGHELAFVIRDFDAKVVFWQDTEIGAAAREARELTGGPGRWIQLDDAANSYEEFITDSPATDPGIRVDADAPVCAIYTAAFDGRPNGALMSHTNIITQCLIIAYSQDVGGESAFLNFGPFFHVGTYMSTLTTLLMGGKNVIMRRSDAEEFCRLISAERCTHAFAPSPTIAQVVELNADRRYDLKSLRTWPSPVSEVWSEMTSLDISRMWRAPNGYGQTELMWRVTSEVFGGPAIGPHGRSTPVAQVRIADGEGNEAPQGEVGEILVRGPTVGLGYWNRPELNQRRIVNGWWRTTDLGKREIDGSITFTGTLTQMIKCGVENIYPAEVEVCLEEHPAIAEAAIIGVPEEPWIQVVKAIVVLKPGAQATADDIVAHCRARIASYKKPRYIEFIDALPRRADGGKDYAALDARFGGGGYPGGNVRAS